MPVAGTQLALRHAQAESLETAVDRALLPNNIHHLNASREPVMSPVKYRNDP